MGQAKITGGGPTGLYNIELVKHAAKSVARLAQIAARLDGSPGSTSPKVAAQTGLNALITAASQAVTDAIATMTAAQAALEESILQEQTPVPSLAAVPRWYNDGNGTCTKVSPGPLCQAGTYTLTFGAVIPGDYGTSPVVPDSIGWSVSTPDGSLPNGRTGAYASSEINFTTTEGSTPFSSGDAFDIAVTDETKVAVTPVKQATAAVLAAQTALTTKRRALSVLRSEKAALTSEQARLTAAMATEARTGIWCTDLTENLAVNAIVGTMEMNGAPDQIILTPGGSVAKSTGLLQHAGVSTPSAVFCNWARLPGWQKWKPTYRVGTITAIDYNANTCSVGIAEQYSSAQGLKINQPGTVYAATRPALQGWSDFAVRNPDFPLVTNTASTNLTMTPSLRADLEAVQAEVNNRNTYQLDTQQYGKLENWALMEEGGAGDCEDFALTKARKLLNLGYPASAIHIETGTTPKGEGHAWLVVQTDQGDLCLDINYQQVMKNELTNYSGRQRQTGLTWSTPGVLLANVPIEYMAGANASCFQTGDDVVVQFTGQAWTSPRVVGFEDHPRGPSLLVISQYANFSGPDVRVFDLNGQMKFRISTGQGARFVARGVAECDGTIYVALQDLYYDSSVAGMVGGDNPLCQHRISRYRLSDGAFLGSFVLPYHPGYDGPAYDGVHGEWGNRRLVPGGIGVMKVSGMRWIYVADRGTAGGFFYDGDYVGQVGMGIWLFSEAGVALAYIAGAGYGGVGDPYLLNPQGVHCAGGRVYVTHVTQMIKSYTSRLALAGVQYFLLHQAPAWAQANKGCAVLGSGSSSRLVAAGQTSLVSGEVGTCYLKTFDLEGNLLTTRTISQYLQAMDALDSERYVAYEPETGLIHMDNAAGTAHMTKSMGLETWADCYIAVTGRHNQ